MSPVEMFCEITERGLYLIGYLMDGGTHQIEIEAKNPSEGMIKTQNLIGNICNVTFVERSWY